MSNQNNRHNDRQPSRRGRGGHQSSRPTPLTRPNPTPAPHITRADLDAATKDVTGDLAIDSRRIHLLGMPDAATYPTYQPTNVPYIADLRIFKRIFTGRSAVAATGTTQTVNDPQDNSIYATHGDKMVGGYLDEFTADTFPTEGPGCKTSHYLSVSSLGILSREAVLMVQQYYELQSSNAYQEHTCKMKGWDALIDFGPGHTPTTHDYGTCHEAFILELWKPLLLGKSRLLEFPSSKLGSLKSSPNITK